jgi:peptidoglycan hydrolase-like protein with peptidoglycan-binding domain
MSGLTESQVATIRKQADVYGLPQAFVLGIVEKESAGHVFWTVNGKQVPPIRPEGHYFYKYLTGAKRNEAMTKGLAAKKAGTVHVPGAYSAVYAMFARMVAIDPEVACMSISMGIGQVMGAHFKKLGYSSATEMYRHCCTGLDGQVEIMLRFITADKALTHAAQTLDYAAFAKGYNGPGYRRNNYDVLLRQHTEKWQGKSAGALAVEAHVGNYAERITALGFGSVEEFQEHHGLTVDGVIGPLTRGKLKDVERANRKAVRAPAAASGAVAAGGASTAVVTFGVTELSDLVDKARQGSTLLQQGETNVQVGANMLNGIGGKAQQAQQVIEQAQDKIQAAQQAFEKSAPYLAKIQAIMHAAPLIVGVMAATVFVAAACYGGFYVYRLWKFKDEDNDDS